MSIVVRPGRFVGDVHPAGKVASTMLSVSVASMADPGRFRRGKMLQIDGAVSRLEIEAGVLKATVQGSRAEPYTVVVQAATVERPHGGAGDFTAQMAAPLMPRAADIVTSCSCPDPDEPCKHAIAALVALAEQVTSQPELLVAWRCHEPGEPPFVPPRRALSASRPPARPRDDGPVVDHTAHPQWESFVVCEHRLSPADLPELPPDHIELGTATVGNVDATAWVESALDVLRSADR